MRPATPPWLSKWLKQTNARRPSAVVLGGSVNGLSFARSLGRRGVPTLLLDSDRPLGAYTRYAAFGLLPPAEEQPGEWLSLLEQAGERLPGPAVLFATSDAHTALVSENQPALARHYRFVVPPAETARQIIDKRRQYEAARAAGIPIPESFFPATGQQAREVAGRVAYPCLLKPCLSHVGRKLLDGRKLVVVHSPAELVTAFARLADRGAQFMVQEIVPGGDNAIFFYLTFVDAEGCERAWFPGQKLRQFPPLYGNGSLSISGETPAVIELSRRVLALFDHRGYAGVEFKLDSRDGSYRLMEMNPRSDSFNEMAVGAGVDFPWIGYQYLTGDLAGPPEPPPFRRGLTYIDDEQDVLAFLELRRSGELSLRRWLLSVWGARPMTAAWDDPLPLLAGLARLPRAFRRDAPIANRPSHTAGSRSGDATYDTR
jgi:predicted ATP-grasp superfamily ATP-dependent carboligase